MQLFITKMKSKLDSHGYILFKHGEFSTPIAILSEDEIEMLLESIKIAKKDKI